MKPKVFVGSSREALPIARAIHSNLDYDAEVTIWSQSLFELSRSTLENLVSWLNHFDFGVFVFSPNDVLTMRGKDHNAVRDNVIFEFGLFVGRLGSERTFFVVPRGEDLHLPSDLLGITPATYDAGRRDGNLRAALDPACTDILRVINKLGPIQRNNAVVQLTQERPVLAFDDDDIKAHLGAWIASHGNRLDRRVIVFSRIDEELGFEPGTTAKYIDALAQEFEYAVAYRGTTSALLRRRRHIPPE
ncbi:MAG TPA: nucleotide-binding protein [Longimicrobiaceae bacterium]|nr:nucleotide-binding protein [Longimicrobiaceae bacterium]